MFADLDRLLAAIPADEVAGQWDVAVEFGVLEEACYGDYGHQHFMQPASLALQVRVLNAVTAAALRLVSFVSFTVPQYQREENYFA
jgi:hypothetical protein